MEVVNPRAALLSNYEVLALLRELEVDHLARTRTAVRVKKEEEAAGVISNVHPVTEQVNEHLRTMEVEAIKHLSADYQPISRQTDASIAQLVKGLATYKLTKAEKLQMVNLVPTTPVELYTVIEELEDRLDGTQIEGLLELVHASLAEAPATPARAGGAAEEADADADADADGTWEEDANEIVFDDTGEGRGVEGDLDMDDD